MVGILSADGNGNFVSGTETQSNNGVIFSGVTLTGTYTVNTDCTGAGAVTLTFPGGTTKVRDFNLVVIDSKSFEAIITDSFRVITFKATRL